MRLSMVEGTEEIEGNDTFRMLTFNTWGLKYISKFRTERLKAIGDRLAGNTTGINTNSSDIEDYDVVALQEIWCQEDWEYIEKVCAKRYPYRRWFSSGIISGPGLAILSKYPIKKTFLYRFPVNGRPSAFYRGDWYVGKSVSASILLLPNNSTVALLNSHMHAPYARSGDAAYEAHRACQAWEISIIVNELRAAGHAVILVGDLNSRPGSLPYRILEDEAGLKDSWELLNGKTDLELVKTMDPWEQIIRAATTCDSILNTWRAQRRPDEACRLDYALIDSQKLRPVKASVKFTEKIPNVGSYSDHFAYAATFKLVEYDYGNYVEGENGNESDIAKNVSNSVLDGSELTVSNPMLAQENELQPKKLETGDVLDDKRLLKVYHDLKDLVNEYMETTLVWQRTWRKWHFIISMAFGVAILPVITVVSYRAPWSSILFYFFGCTVFVSGVIDGLISLLFGRYELRNMKEVVLEVEDRIKFVEEFGLL